MLFKSVILPIVSSLALANAAPNADAEALAAALPAPVAQAMAQAFAAEDPASYGCHENCGYLIIEARKCTPDANADTVDFGPWDQDCLCTEGSLFEELVEPCLECGWCLWSDYGKYLVAPLEECGYTALPTGTMCTELAASATARVTAQLSATLASLGLSTYPVAPTDAAAASNSSANGTTTSSSSSSSNGTASSSSSSAASSGESSTASDAAAKLQLGAGVVGIIGAALLL